MSERIKRSQMMAPLQADAAFAEWYVEEFMKVHVPEYYFDEVLSDEGKREMTIQGRTYAKQFGIKDTPSQMHFVTLMWKIGANFFTHDGFLQVAQDPTLDGPAKISAFYGMPREQAIHAVMNPDDRYWYPDQIPKQG